MPEDTRDALSDITNITGMLSVYVCVYIYTRARCYTEQNSVLFSTRVSVLFSIFEVLGVVLTDTEHGSVVLSIFSGQF
jgi:hypothetical protein